MSHVDIDIGGFFIKFDKKDHSFTIDEPVTGTLHLKLRSSIASKGLYLRIAGKLGVLWRDTENAVLGDNNEPFTTLENFLDEKIYFLKPNSDNETIQIDKGDHEYKFSFRLIDFVKGANVTQSKLYAAFPFSSEHEYGNVKYMVTGILPRSLNDYDYQTVQHIKVISTVGDSGEMHKHFLPYKSEQAKDASLLSGGSSSTASSSSSMSNSKTALKVIVNKTAYRPGETINALIRLENDSSMKKFSKIYVKLIQTAIFHSKSPRAEYKVVKHDIFSYKQTDFDNHRLYEMDELIQIPKSTNPPSTLDPSHHIQYKYDIKIELYTSLKFLPGSTGQVEISIPIIIYNKLTGGTDGEEDNSEFM